MGGDLFLASSLHRRRADTALNGGASDPIVIGCVAGVMEILAPVESWRDCAVFRSSFLTFLSAALIVAATPTQAQVTQAFDVSAPFPPTIVSVAGVPELSYEIHLTNFSSLPLSLDRLSIIDAADRPLGEFRDEILRGMLGPAGAARGEDISLVAPGDRIVLYVNLPLPDKCLPVSVRHRIDFRVMRKEGDEPASILTREIAVDADKPLRLGPPLRGGPWAAVYDPMMERGHQRVFYAVDGEARIPGRFAIDFFRVDDSGARAPAGATRPADFYGRGAEVLAVGDGVIAAARDDMAEPQSVGERPTSLDDAAGNYIALDLGEGRYAFYEHLSPGLLAKQGQKVRKGDVIARLGFTGEGTEPHLHFHVGDANSPLAAEGLAFVFDGFEVAGGYPSIEVFGRNQPWTPRASGPAGEALTRPAPNAVIRFPGG